MGGYSKLALVAAGVVACWMGDAKAAIMTETPFVAYYQTQSPSGVRWLRGASFNQYFIRFIKSGSNAPESTATNIAWVERHSDPDFAPVPAAPGSATDPADSSTPPWRDNSSSTPVTPVVPVTPVPVPEPGTAALALAGMVYLAARRKNA